MSIADKLVTIAENEQKVFDAGYIEGFKAVYGDISGSGRFPEKFWELYQEGGERTDYSGAFRNWSWYQFTPKYPLTNITNGFECFRNFNNAGANGGRPYRGGVDMRGKDVKVSGNADNMFLAAVMDCIGTVDFSKATSFNRAFYSSEIRKINKLIWSDALSNISCEHIFDYASTLEEIKIEGTITQDYINLQWSTKLTSDSLVSLIQALGDKTSSFNRPKLVIGSANKAKIPDTMLQQAIDKGWEVL